MFALLFSKRRRAPDGMTTATGLASRERSAHAVAELVDQLSRTVANDSFATGLNPAQWAALRYVAQANETARNVGAFARHHLITPSSASQTIQALVRKKLVTKRSGTDRRSRSLEVTPQGQQALRSDPLNRLTKAIATLPESQLLGLADALVSLLKDAAARRKGGDTA
jgi:DNA-binding MarR family transcriptional regulator